MLMEMYSSPKILLGSFGGALYAFRKGTGPNLNNVAFSDISAESGGAVFFSAVGTNLHMSSGSEYENIALYASTFNGCRFEGNSASSKGGAIYSALGSDYVWNTTFKGNSATTGGGISISVTVYLSNSSFEDSISGDGGVPAVSNGGIASKMVGLYFSGNGCDCSSDTYMGINEVGFELLSLSYPSIREIWSQFCIFPRRCLQARLGIHQRGPRIFRTRYAVV